MESSELSNSAPLNKTVFLTVVLLTATVFIRVLLYPRLYSDFTLFYDYWTNILRGYGPSAIASDFSNYNTPYLLLLWLYSKFIPANLAVVKGVTLTFEILMAIGVLKTVEHFKPNGYTKYLAAALVLILPTVLINGADWGQSDSILGALAIWTIYFCLKERMHLAWIVCGILFAVKMQGIFIVPFLFAISLNRRKAIITGPLLAIASCAVFSAPTLLVGDTPARILSVFTRGAGSTFESDWLSWWMSNLPQWFSNQYYGVFRLVFIGLGLAICIALVIYGYKSKRFSDEVCLLLAAFCLMVLPFILPQMHGRYYYQGEIALLVLAFALPRMSWYVYLSQVVAMATFLIALTGVEQNFMAFRFLSIGIFVVLAGLVKCLYIYHKGENKYLKDGFDERGENSLP
jgi:Gpi18-like mannosyltransferase